MAENTRLRKLRSFACYRRLCVVGQDDSTWGILYNLRLDNLTLENFGNGVPCQTIPRGGIEEIFVFTMLST